MLGPAAERASRSGVAARLLGTCVAIRQRFADGEPIRVVNTQKGAIERALEEPGTITLYLAGARLEHQSSYSRGVLREFANHRDWDERFRLASVWLSGCGRTAAGVPSIVAGVVKFAPEVTESPGREAFEGLGGATPC